MADQYQLPPGDRDEPGEPSVPIENVEPPRKPPARSPRDRRWLPMLLIGGGVLLFLANTGAFASIAWSVLLPLGMLAVGLDLITEGRSRRRIAIGALVAAPVLVLLVGGASMLRASISDARPSGARPDPVSLEGIDRLRVEIKQSAANVKLRALDDDSDELFSSNDPQPEFRREGNTGVLVVQRSGWNDGNAELMITPNLPLDLKIEVNGGNADLGELEETRLETLQLNVRAGNAELALPQQGVKRVAVDNTAGNIDVSLPEELAARIEANASLGNVRVDEDRFTKRDGVWYSSSYVEDADNQATIRLTAQTGNIEVE